MSKKITAQQVIIRIKDQLSDTWKDSSADIFNAGKPDTIVTGIVTSFTPSVDVLKQAVAAGRNLVITQQPAFYLETEEYLQNDPAFLYKRDFIDRNNLVLWRFYDNWNAREEDGQLLALAKALGWNQYHVHDSSAGMKPYAKANRFFKL
ncbi:MAG: hypothetical protein ABIS01_06030, partial [Ferruginibacter sp.]